jgi:NADPH:quinone reductase-like Zn-dependent oxidoreductase
MTTMKAVRIHGYGGPEVLQVEDMPRPEPGTGEVLVRVHASGVNPVDWKVREGYMRQMVPLELPAVLGLDFSGVIDSVGAGVSRFRAGDAVFGRADIAHDGSYAEYVRVAADNVVRKPERLDHVHAAAVPTAALTAWEALIEAPPPAQAAGVARGQTVLIHGAAGGVGSFAVQFAKIRGARVIATASAQRAAYLRNLGADVIVDYRTQRFEEVARDVDVVLDTVGGETQARSWAVLRRGGVLASTVGVDASEAERHGVRAIAVFATMSAPILERIAERIDQGQVQVPVSQVLPLAETRRAHEESQSGHVEGKLVLSVVG